MTGLKRERGHRRGEREKKITILHTCLCVYVPIYYATTLWPKVLSLEINMYNIL